MVIYTEDKMVIKKENGKLFEFPISVLYSETENHHVMMVERPNDFPPSRDYSEDFLLAATEDKLRDMCVTSYWGAQDQNVHRGKNASMKVKDGLFLNFHAKDFSVTPSSQPKFELKKLCE